MRERNLPLEAGLDAASNAATIQWLGGAGGSCLSQEAGSYEVPGSRSQTSIGKCRLASSKLIPVPLSGEEQEPGHRLSRGVPVVVLPLPATNGAQEDPTRRNGEGLLTLLPLEDVQTHVPPNQGSRKERMPILSPAQKHAFESLLATRGRTPVAVFSQ